MKKAQDLFRPLDHSPKETHQQLHRFFSAQKSVTRQDRDEVRIPEIRPDGSRLSSTTTEDCYEHRIECFYRINRYQVVNPKQYAEHQIYTLKQGIGVEIGASAGILAGVLTYSFVKSVMAKGIIKSAGSGLIAGCLAYLGVKALRQKKEVIDLTRQTKKNPFYEEINHELKPRR